MSPPTGYILPHPDQLLLFGGVLRGACKLVEFGHSILFWSEPWIPGLSDFKPVPKASLETIHCRTVS